MSKIKEDILYIKKNRRDRNILIGLKSNGEPGYGFVLVSSEQYGDRGEFRRYQLVNINERKGLDITEIIK